MKSDVYRFAGEFERPQLFLSTLTPVTPEASLAFLWAVEDALDVPDHRRYSELFFSWV
jgi:hypothetical protein